MKTLDRYILGKVASRFGMLLTIFIGVVIGGQLGTFIGRGVPPEALLGVIPTFVLLSLPIAVPLASSTALLVAIGGMVRAGEFQALAAAGVDPRRVILRMWTFVVVVALLVAVLAHVALPVATSSLRANMGRLLQAAIATKVADRKPIRQQDGLSVWAENVEGRKLTDVYIRRTDEGGDLAVYAPRAEWALTERSIEFRLEDVRLIQVRANGDLIAGEATHYIIQPDSRSMVLDTEPDAMTTPDVLALLALGPKGGLGSESDQRSRFNNARLTIHLRAYLPFAVFAYALFAAGLGLVLALSEGLAGISIVVVIVALATYPAIGFVKSNPYTAQMDPGIFLWGPGLLLSGLGWWMLARPERMREWLARPLSALSKFLRNLIAMVMRLVRKLRA